MEVLRSNHLAGLLNVSFVALIELLWMHLEYPSFLESILSQAKRFWLPIQLEVKQSSE